MGPQAQRPVVAPPEISVSWEAFVSRCPSSEHQGQLSSAESLGSQGTLSVSGWAGNGDLASFPVCQLWRPQYFHLSNGGAQLVSLYEFFTGQSILIPYLMKWRKHSCYINLCVCVGGILYKTLCLIFVI